jgi:hypothetical protein
MFWCCRDTLLIAKYNLAVGAEVIVFRTIFGI